MKESEMRIRLVHQRAKELQQKAEWNRLRRSAGISSFLCIALIAVFSFLGLHSTSYANGSYTGSLLLSESTGGYVLVGVAAFMAGVMITVIIKKYLNKKADKKHDDSNTEVMQKNIIENLVHTNIGGEETVKKL